MLNIFGKNSIESIEIHKEVVKKIMDLSRDSHPKEFLAFLEGDINKDKIVITDIIFQPYIADEESAMPTIDLPLTTTIMGSIHSHPGKSNKPSPADLRFFHKTGIIHAITNHPYTQKDIQFYDIHGNPINIKII